MPLLGAEDLRRTLARIDGRGYKAYQDLRGDYRLGIWTLSIAHVQADPYAPPSRVHARADLAATGLAPFAAGPAARLRALEDFLARRLAEEIRGRDARDLSVDHCGQEVLLRSIVRVRPGEPEGLEARLCVQLPAAGRRILGRAAARLLLEDLPGVLAGACTTGPVPDRGGAPPVDARALRSHQDAVEDHAALVRALDEQGWVAFVADGSLLPRRSGRDDRPLEAPEPGRGDPATVVPFQAPPSLAREVELPHAGRVRGLAVPAGVTLLVGGGFHGKSTLLEAISRGIHPHVPGDGRERVAADSLAVKVRAEDGRAVTGTDISPFIGALPYGRPTDDFHTPNASGSTSQAANIIEALEAGARALLIDEDTSATNFMIRDEPMRRLLRPGQEPITPFLDRVRNLHRDRGVSTVLVVGGSGEYFRVADRVIQMDGYRPVDVTDRARAIAPPGPESADPFPPAGPLRRLDLGRYRGGTGPRGPRVKAQAAARILVDREEVDLGACEQIISPAQVRTLAAILERLLAGSGRVADWPDLAGGLTAEQMRRALAEAGAEVLDRVSRHPRGDLAEVRSVEVMAMLNRLRELEVIRT